MSRGFSVLAVVALAAPACALVPTDRVLLVAAPLGIQSQCAASGALAAAYARQRLRYDPSRVMEVPAGTSPDALIGSVSHAVAEAKPTPPDLLLLYLTCSPPGDWQPVNWANRLLGALAQAHVTPTPRVLLVFDQALGGRDAGVARPGLSVLTLAPAGSSATGGAVAGAAFARAVQRCGSPCREVLARGEVSPGTVRWLESLDRAIGGADDPLDAGLLSTAPARWAPAPGYRRAEYRLARRRLTVRITARPPTTQATELAGRLRQVIERRLDPEAARGVVFAETDAPGDGDQLSCVLRAFMDVVGIECADEQERVVLRAPRLSADEFDPQASELAMRVAGAPRADPGEPTPALLDTASAAAERSTGRVSTATWAVGGGAVAALVSGIVLLGVMAASDADLEAQLRARDETGAVTGISQREALEADARNTRLELAGWTLVGVGGAAAVTALVLAFTGDGGASDAGAGAAAPGPHMQLEVGPDRLMVGVSQCF